jgi:ATP-dependent Lon protease
VTAAPSEQKLLAVYRAGITTVLLPRRNEPALEDVPASVREELTGYLVGDVREVLDLALALSIIAAAAV